MVGSISKYFSIGFKYNRNVASAWTEFKTPIAHLIEDEVITSQELPFTLIIKKIVSTKNGIETSDDLSGLKHIWLDYQPNNLAWPLMSEKMKELIAIHLTGNEGIIWIMAKVKQNEIIKNYYIPIFEKKLNVLDEEKTIFAANSNHIVIPVYSLSKIASFSMFHCPREILWRITTSLYISEVIKSDFQKHKISGLEFNEVPISDI